MPARVRRRPLGTGARHSRTSFGGGCCFVATLPLAQEVANQAKSRHDDGQVLAAGWPTGRPQFVEIIPRHKLFAHQNESGPP